MCVKKTHNIENKESLDLQNQESQITNKKIKLIKLKPEINAWKRYEIFY